MEAETPVMPVRPDEARWTAAAHCVNALRGQIMQAFSSTEAAVSEALLRLAEVPVSGEGVRLRHLIGQRF